MSELKSGETINLVLDARMTTLSTELLTAIKEAPDGSVALDMSNTGLTSIGNSAFTYCYSLASITYSATKDDWNSKIKTFGMSWRAYVPATGVTCSDGKTYAWATSSGGKLGDEITQ